MQESGFWQQMKVPLVLLIFVIIMGTIGYYQLWVDQGGTWGEALYMTVITITTIGYGEVYGLDGRGRAFSIMIALLGIGTMSYVLGRGMEYVVANQLLNIREMRRMKQAINDLHDHTVVAGYGQMGQWVARELSALGKLFVVVEADPVTAQKAEEQGYLLVTGDASQDEILEKAGIARAQGLIATTSSDAINAFVVMGARSLNNQVHIVARAESDDAVKKLRRAGANAVTNSYALVGHSLVEQLKNEPKA